MAIDKKIDYLTHEARLLLASEYVAGKRDQYALPGHMVRLILCSLEREYEQELSLLRKQQP